MAEVPTVFSGFMVQAAKPSGRKQSGPSKTALVLKRTKEREAANERRKEQAEKLKAEGNNHFRQGHFVDAIAKYNEAVKIYGLRPIIMSNLAAAYLKLEQFELAEWACDCALLHSPHSAKARFRRAMARKGQGMFKGAELDLTVVINHHSEITEAQEELSKVREERKKHGDGQRPEPTFNEAFPPFEIEEWDPPLDSDSEDARNTGNERPCRFHNHGGCRNGSRCDFSHAPDDQSVRNSLGQNVCLHFLLGDCKFGTRCSYSHSRDHLPQGWWSTPKQIEEAKRLRAALDDPEAEDYGVIENLENTTVYGRLKKSQDYREDFKVYSVLRSDVLMSRIKDKSQKTPIQNTPKDRSLVVVLCLQDPDTFKSTNGHLLQKLKTKAKVVFAENATQVSTYLKAPELAGVVVGDAGITDHSRTSTVSQLADYARNGGSVVFGGLFPSFISGSEFNRFFSQHFGLPWKRGSYFRATFYKNTGNDVVKKNPSLDPSYSMKALHVQGITPESAVYKANESSRTQSSVFPPNPITDFKESPAVSTLVGKGSVSFLGDVNAEDESTKTIMAMLGLLDSPVLAEPTPSIPEQGAEGKKKKSKSKNKAEETRQTHTPYPPSSTSSATSMERLWTTDLRSGFIMQLSLYDSEASDNFTSKQIQAITMKTEVKKATTVGQAVVLLSSPDLTGVYVTDSALADQKFTPLVRRVVSYVKGGGILVFGGSFSSFTRFPRFAALFAEFGLGWKAATCSTEQLELNSDSIVYQHTFLPKKVSIRAVFLEGVEPESVVYRPSRVTRELQTPIAFGEVGDGCVGYIGDVRADSCTTPILLTMFELLMYPRRPERPATCNGFVITLVRFGFIDEYEKTPLFKQLKEKRIEIVTDKELSDPRLADLLSSPDLLGVLVLDISDPEREWLNHEVATYVWSGGTVIFCGDAAMSPPHELECFLADSFCLPWKISSATELPVKLNEENELVKRLPHTTTPKSIRYEGSFLYDVSQDAVVYSSDPGLGPEEAAHVPVAHTTVGAGFVGFSGRDEINELDTKLVLGMLLGQPRAHAHVA